MSNLFTKKFKEKILEVEKTLGRKLTGSEKAFLCFLLLRDSGVDVNFLFLKRDGYEVL